MKRFLSIFMLILLIVLSASCSKQEGLPETSAPAQEVEEEQNNQDETPIPAPTPEMEFFVPEDIFSSELNPYGDVVFPDNFSVYGASFNMGVEKIGGKPHYVLSMTAEDETDESVIFLANLAGQNEETASKYVEDFKSNKFCEFLSAEGSETFTVRKTDPNDDRYSYVDGCHIDITVNLDDEEALRYIQLVGDNFNVNALALLDDYFDTTPMYEECVMTLNLHKNEVTVDMRYDIDNFDIVEANIIENINSNWYDANTHKMGLSYGIMNIELVFDAVGSNIYIRETTDDFKTAMSAYIEPEFSLAKMGFGFDKEGLCGVYEQHQPHYTSVAIHRPEWGEFDCDWNIEFMDEVNGYFLRITYHQEEDKYHITSEKDNKGAAYDYYPAENKYTGEYPDYDTVKQIFNNTCGTEGDDFYDEPLSYFEQLVYGNFGMGIGEIYMLPKK